MTVGELIKVASNCKDVEIIVRKEGFSKWIHGYRIGPNVQLFRYEHRIENREKARDWKFKEPGLKNGEEVDIENSARLPMTVIKTSLTKIPEAIAHLNVSYFQPRSIPYIYGEPMTHNDFSLEIVCFPEGYEPEVEKYDVKKDLDENGQLIGQMSLKDLIGE